MEKSSSDPGLRNSESLESCAIPNSTSINRSDEIEDLTVSNSNQGIPNYASGAVPDCKSVDLCYILKMNQPPQIMQCIYVCTRLPFLIMRQVSILFSFSQTWAINFKLDEGPQQVNEI